MQQLFERVEELLKELRECNNQLNQIELINQIKSLINRIELLLIVSVNSI